MEGAWFWKAPIPLSRSMYIQIITIIFITPCIMDLIISTLANNICPIYNTSNMQNVIVPHIQWSTSKSHLYCFTAFEVKINFQSLSMY